MNRRAAIALLGGSSLALAPRDDARAAPLPPFWASRLSDVESAVKRVKKGQARVLGRSAGAREIALVSYGARDDRRATANYNSACAAGDPAAYARKDGSQAPVVFLLGPVHGAEFEGIVGLINLIEVAETGKDLRGKPWDELAENLARCRVLIIPSGNPDGRARCPFDSWVGVDLATNEGVGMGVKPDGTNYHWPDVKRVHPMRGEAVKALGAYFNDDGVNPMQDDWFDPMAPETRAFLKVAREEAPDYLVSFHSHASHPSVEPTAYVPRTVKQAVQQLGDRVQRRYAAAGLPARAGGPKPVEDGTTFPPPSFNLASALHHVCGGVSLVYECPVGVRDKPFPPVTHEQILDLQLLFADELFRVAVAQPVKWAR
jgi:hypothetical protein